MESGGRILTREWPKDPDQLALLSEPRDDVLLEEALEPTDPSVLEFAQEDGPFTTYGRQVEIREDALIETTSYRVIIPWFRWLFRWPVQRVLTRHISYRSWWAPPDRLDATQVLVLGLLAAASMSAAFVNTLFTQTVNFAADEFGINDTGIGIAGAVVRGGILIALPAAMLADRIGRRRVIVTIAWLGPLLSLLGAFAPSFAILVLTQTLARPMGIALAFLVGVVAAEEMPRNSRAYAISILAMAAGFGAGIAVLSLRLADIGAGGWRLVYVISIVWCIVALDLTRRLPETRRFEAVQVRARERPPRLNRRRFALLATVAFAGNIFIAPASFFQNRYLTDIHDFSGGMIGIFSIAVGTPASIGLILGGRIADTRGRRRLIAIALPASTAAVIGAYMASGPPLWMLSLMGAMLGSAAYPALAVYRAELFPTENRSRATGFITGAALIGGMGGLIATGRLLDADWSYGSVMALMAIGQVIVTVLVITAYPETAHLTLETLNPEDPPINLHDEKPRL
ncbi:MAG: MFS transporter [Actinobacteria bacterium]|nr:MFS transporter [Actinomycetota bacterium]